MKEIKFRAWDSGVKKMMPVFSLTPKLGVVLIGEKTGLKQFDDEYGAPMLTYKWDGLQFMQTTGLKDRDGKEIFEGDIVRSMDYADPADPVIIQAVKYMPHLGSYVLYTACCSDTEWDEMIYQAVSDKFGNMAFHEIVGNIYENPDLLSTSQE